MPLPSISLQRLNVMNPLVEWFFDPQVTSAKKVAACALGVVAYLGAVHKIGFIAASLFGISLLGWGVYELGVRKEVETRKSEEMRESLEKRERISEAIAVRRLVDYENLKEVNSPGGFFQKGPGNLEHSIGLDGMSQSMMRGVTQIGETDVPSVFLRVKRRIPLPNLIESMIVVYLGDQKETWGYRIQLTTQMGCRRQVKFQSETLQDGVKDLIESLQKGTHSQFELIK